MDKQGMYNETEVSLQKKLTRSEIRQKKRRRLLKRVIVFVLFTVTLVLLALSPLFNITKVEVYGNQHYKSDSIVNATDIVIRNNGFKILSKGIKNIFLLRYMEAEQSIEESHPYIKDVKVKYVIPNRFRIDIIERKPVVSIPYIGTNLIMDKEGVILDAVDDAKRPSIPVVTGLKFERYELGQPLHMNNPESLRIINTLIETIAQSEKGTGVKLTGLIKYMDVSDLNKVMINLDSRITVNLGNLDNLAYRLDFLKQIYAKGLKKNEKGFLDLTTGNNPNFIPD
ncbi:MAG: FtsQ-type POTRA domain-containing protein [Clostridia bacterium]|nr:FtsQ-type POTRA domain-containing protein [Clostridia bacterium]